MSLVIISGGGYSVSSADQSAESELYQTSKVSQPALRHNDKVVEALASWHPLIEWHFGVRFLPLVKLLWQSGPVLEELYKQCFT